MNVTEEPEIAIFETDFGVTFGHFICFDILFKSPAQDLITSNISHILYPSMWFSETPFLSSIQIQQNYAYRNNIVLISSGTNSPLNSNTGSGIFVGKHGAIDSIISYRNESKMLVGKIPKDVNDVDFIPPKSLENEPYSPVEMDSLKLWSFTPKITFPLQESLIAHHDNIECEFSVNFTELAISDENTGYHYRFAIFQGLRNYANIKNGGEAYCAIIPCVHVDSLKCGEKMKNSKKLVPSFLFHSIKITASIQVKDNPDSYMIMPTSLDFSIRPLQVEKFNFEDVSENDDIKKYEMKSLNELSDIMTFGIYGRNFNLDSDIIEEDNDEVITSTLKLDDEPVKVQKESHNIINIDCDDKNIFIKMSIYVVLMIVLCIIAAILVYRRLQKPYEHPLIVLRRKSEMIQ